MPANATDATTNNYKNTDIVFALNTVSPYVRIVHPAKAVGQNEVPYTTETHVVSNVLLDRDLVLHGKRRFGEVPPKNKMIAENCLAPN